MTDLVRYFLLLLAAVVFAAVATAAVLGALQEFRTWRTRRARDVAELEAHLEALRDDGLGVLSDFKPAAGRPHIAALQARAMTPAEVEWERRLARWTAEARAEDQRRKGEES